MIHANSRLTLTEVIEVIDPLTGQLVKPAFVDLRPRVTATAPDDEFVTVTSAKDWPHYALERLGSAEHWWVLADLSYVIDPFEELVPGKQLRAPSVERFYFQILSPDQTA